MRLIIWIFLNIFVYLIEWHWFGCNGFLGTHMETAGQIAQGFLELLGAFMCIAQDIKEIIK